VKGLLSLSFSERQQKKAIPELGWVWASSRSVAEWGVGVRHVDCGAVGAGAHRAGAAGKRAS
jgi:hypothetical protein